MLHRATLTLLLAAVAQGASAQAMLDPSLSAIAEFARGVSHVESVEPAAGEDLPAVLGTVDGWNYDILLYGCAAGDVGCGSAQFRASFTDTEATLEFVNAWNYDRRFASAYLMPDGDIVLTLDVNLRGGVTRDGFGQSFDDWIYLLNEFGDRIFPPETPAATK